MLPLHLQNEVVHPDGQIRAGFGDDHKGRADFVDAASITSLVLIPIEEYN